MTRVVFIASVPMGFTTPEGAHHLCQYQPCSSGNTCVFSLLQSSYFALCITCSRIPVDKKDPLALCDFVVFTSGLSVTHGSVNLSPEVLSKNVTLSCSRKQEGRECEEHAAVVR